MEENSEPLVTPLSIAADAPLVPFVAKPPAKPKSDKDRLERLAQPRAPTTNPNPNRNNPSMAAPPKQQQKPLQTLPPWNWQNPKAQPSSKNPPQADHQRIMTELNAQLDKKMAAMEDRLMAALEEKLKGLGGGNGMQLQCQAAEAQTGMSLSGSSETSAEVVEARTTRPAPAQPEKDNFIKLLENNPRLLDKVKGVAMQELEDAELEAASNARKAPVRSNPRHERERQRQPLQLMQETKRMTITQTNSVLVSPRSGRHPHAHHLSSTASSARSTHDGVSLAAETYLARSRHHHDGGPHRHANHRHHNEHQLQRYNCEADRFYRTDRRPLHPPQHRIRRNSGEWGGDDDLDRIYHAAPSRQRLSPPLPPLHEGAGPQRRRSHRHHSYNSPRHDEPAESSYCGDEPITLGDWQTDRYNHRCPRDDSDSEEVFRR